MLCIVQRVANLRHSSWSTLVLLLWPFKLTVSSGRGTTYWLSSVVWLDLCLHGRHHVYSCPMKCRAVCTVFITLIIIKKWQTKIKPQETIAGAAVVRLHNILVKWILDLFHEPLMGGWFYGSLASNNIPVNSHHQIRQTTRYISYYQLFSLLSRDVSVGDKQFGQHYWGRFTLKEKQQACVWGNMAEERKCSKKESLTICTHR